MVNHKFNEAEVLMLERRVGEKFKREKFTKFIDTANELGFKVRVTGGNFLTHEINSTEEDFNVILELLA